MTKKTSDDDLRLTNLNHYLDRPLRGSDFCSDMGEMSEEVLDVP